MSSKPLLTIVIPFFNAASKSDRLVARLSGTLPSDVEIICVDDGSTDDTPRVLERLQHTIGASCRVIRQSNRGPGGARNTGLFAARGEFVWFVDADDDVRFEGVQLLRSMVDSPVQFVDFNLVESGRSVDSMELADGVYAVSTPSSADTVTSARLIERFGRVVSKAFRRSFLLSHHIFFPELCVYEDNAFAIITATRTTSFVKRHVDVYDHHIEHDSVTRGGAGGIRSPRFYDRLLTVRYAMSEVGFGDLDANARAAATARFVELFLFNSISLKPANADTWLTSLRVVREFRDGLEALGIHPSRVEWAKAGQVKGAILRFVFLASRSIPSQHDYFRDLRHKAWGQYALEIPAGPADSFVPELGADRQSNARTWPPVQRAGADLASGTSVASGDVNPSDGDP